MGLLAAVLGTVSVQKAGKHGKGIVRFLIIGVILSVVLFCSLPLFLVLNMVDSVNSAVLPTAETTAVYLMSNNCYVTTVGEIQTFSGPSEDSVTDITLPAGWKYRPVYESLADKDDWITLKVRFERSSAMEYFVWVREMDVTVPDCA